MQNQDPEPAIAGIDLTNSFSAALRNFHSVAEEIGRISRSSFAQNAKLIDDLSAARDMSDVVAIQTKFVTGMFETFNEQVRLLMSQMAEIPGNVSPRAETPAAQAQDPQKPAAPDVSAIADEPGMHETSADAGPAASKAEQDLAEAADAAAQSLVEATSDSLRLTAKASRDAWQELAKAAAELLRDQDSTEESAAASPPEPPAESEGRSA